VELACNKICIPTPAVFSQVLSPLLFYWFGQDFAAPVAGCAFLLPLLQNLTKIRKKARFL
jgi:hypothetical protein